jgi:hypothetical protein
MAGLQMWVLEVFIYDNGWRVCGAEFGDNTTAAGQSGASDPSRKLSQRQPHRRNQGSPT